MSSVRLDLSMVFARDVQGKKRTPQIGDVCAASSAGTCASLASARRISICHFIGCTGGQAGTFAGLGYAKRAWRFIYALWLVMENHVPIIALRGRRVHPQEYRLGL